MYVALAATSIAHATAAVAQPAAALAIAAAALTLAALALAAAAVAVAAVSVATAALAKPAAALAKPAAALAASKSAAAVPVANAALALAASTHLPRCIPNEPSDPEYCKELATFDDKLAKCKRDTFQEKCKSNCGYCPLHSGRGHTALGAATPAPFGRADLGKRSGERGHTARGEWKWD